jgi:hypothetical protein
MSGWHIAVETVIPKVIDGQKSELEKEIEALEAEAKKMAAEIKQLVRKSLF